MALVTVQRSPSPSTEHDSELTEGEEGSSVRSPLRNRSLSESYFTVRGAALILPQGERPRRNTKKSHGGDIQHHLQSMLYLLRHEDRIKVAVKLESSGQAEEDHQRYMALVSTVGRQDTEESVILGIDYKKDVSTVGLVLPIYNGTQIRLDGDGGFYVRVAADDRKYLFNPVSVQAMWSALQSLQKAVKVSEDETYIPNGLTHTWVQYYTSQIDSHQAELVTLWHMMEGVEVSLSRMITTVSDTDAQHEIKLKITNRLTEVMMQADLDVATSRILREAVEEKLGCSIKEHREYFDLEMMRIFGQMDSPSKILDFLYLGTEWNASNIDELTENGVKYILNVTREIDNFFPGQMKYMNIRLYDVEESQLLPHWDKTYRFISKAKKNNSKVLVHCKRGISRSASTVIAYLMKENRWSLEEALDFVYKRRDIIRPNDGFMEQLRCYEGILNASNQRHVFKSQSVENLLDKPRDEDDQSAGAFLDDGDLYHQMFDSQFPQPASEEEVLRSLGRGRGLEDTDMHRIGTDFETGSRSTDSLEESLPDIPSPTPDQQEFSQKLKVSSKGEYCFMTQYESVPSGEVAGLELIRTEYESDVTDEASPCPRGAQSTSPVNSITDCAGRDSDSLRLSEENGSQTRLRPDNSWIKLKLENEADNAAASCADVEEPQLSASPPKFIIGEDFDVQQSKDERKSPVLVLENMPESSRIRSASLGHGKRENSAKSEDLTRLSIRNRTASLGNRKSEETSEETVEQDVKKEMDKDEEQEEKGVEKSKEEVSVTRKAQLGITQYYTSEQIPWSPGTVMKMKSEIGKNNQASDEDSDSSQKDSEKQHVSVTKDNLSDKNVSEINKDVPSDKEIQTADTSVRLTQSCVELVAHDDDQVNLDSLVRPKSVYEAEEIEFPEGFVQKFKNMIEGNGSSESRPVQRSASLKEERDQTVRTKRSTRRKTCSPILSPHPQSPEDSPPEAEEDSKEISDDPDPKPKEEVEDVDKNYTLIKCGNEEVPLEKGLVRKHKQDFESRTDFETRKRLSSESSVTSVAVDAQEVTSSKEETQPLQREQSPKELVSAEQSLQTSGSQPVPTPSTGESSDSSSVVSERLIKNVREQTSILEGKESTEPEPLPSRSMKKSKKDELSPVDPKTLAKMREFGSELLNKPVEEKEDDPEDMTLVRQAVRSIEKDSKSKKTERKIIIIEDESKDKTKPQGQQPLSEKSRSFDDGGSVGAKRTRQWVRDGGSSSLESYESEKSANRAGLSLNLVEQDQGSEAEQGQANISPRSDSEPSIVRHLVGRFEKDIKSPMSETGESGSNRSSISMEFGLCFTDKRKREESDIEMRPKSTTAENVNRPLRPKSADHLSRPDPLSQRGQGYEDNQLTAFGKHITPKNPDQSEEVRKVRRLQGQPKPVIQRLGASPFYNTM